MQEIADYTILIFEQFTLDIDTSTRSMEFILPSNTSISAGGVLAFGIREVAIGFGGGNIVKVELYSNGNKLKTYNLKTGTFGSLLEVFPGGGDNLKFGKNKITFTIPNVGLSESITISDVVLWYQRNI